MLRARAERRVEESYRERDRYRLLGSGLIYNPIGVYGGTSIWPRTVYNGQRTSYGSSLNGTYQKNGWSLVWSFGY